MTLNTVCSGIMGASGQSSTSPCLPGSGSGCTRHSNPPSSRDITRAPPSRRPPLGLKHLPPPPPQVARAPAATPRQPQRPPDGRHPRRHPRPPPAAHAPPAAPPRPPHPGLALITITAPPHSSGTPSSSALRSTRPAPRPTYCTLPPPLDGPVRLSPTTHSLQQAAHMSLHLRSPHNHDRSSSTTRR